MGGGLLAAAAIGLVFLALVSKTMGFKFFMAGNNGYEGVIYGYIPSTPQGGEYLSPTAMTAWLVNNSAFQVILIAAISLLVFGWWGTVFLSSTRMIFASAFDRILPERAAAVTRGGVPYVALLLMAIPSVIVSAFYAYADWFIKLTYDATLVIAIMFLGSGPAFMIMPWRTGDLGGLGPAQGQDRRHPVMAIVAAGYSAFLVFNLYLWFYDPTNTYGIGYKNSNSMIFMGILYVAASSSGWSPGRCASARAWRSRRSQGDPCECHASWGERPLDVGVGGGSAGRRHEREVA
jgi:amino acid transporter